MNRQQLEIDNYQEENYLNQEEVDQDDDQEDIEYQVSSQKGPKHQTKSDNFINQISDVQSSTHDQRADQDTLMKRPQIKTSSIQHKTQRIVPSSTQVRKGSHQNLIRGQQQNMMRQAMTSLESDNYPPQVMHQFNQPHIINYTHNAFFGSPYNQPFNPATSNQHTGLPQWKPKGFSGSPQQQNKKKRPTSAIHNSTMRSKEEERHQNYFAYNAASGKQKGAMLTDFTNSGYRKKIIPHKMFYDREDLYDQNILVKLKNNEYSDENTQLKTKLAIMSNQMKEKDRLIDEIYKSAYITSNGQQANKNLNKDVLMNVKLKKKVHDLKDILNNKEMELNELKKLMKSTKLKEMEIENKMILQECFRLRGIAENSIRLSGELDIEKMKRDRQIEMQNYNNALYQFQNQKALLDQEIDKLKNDVKEEKEESAEWQDKYEGSQKKVNQLMKDIEKLMQTNQAQLDQRDNQIKKLKESLTDARVNNSNLQQQMDELNLTLEETKKKIPLRPEAEYIEEINAKNDKIEELLDELTQKDTLIDQQAVLNKNMQKKADGLSQQLKELTESKEELKSMVEIENEKNQDLQNVIDAMKKRLQDMEVEKQKDQEALTQNYEERLKALNQQVEDSIKQKMNLQEQISKLSQIDTIKRDNPIVVELFQKIKRICQVKQIKNDEVEKLLFEDDQRPELKLTISELQQLLMEKLNANESDSLVLARYLIEPSDEEKIEFTENRKASTSTIIVRIMNQIRDLKIYSEADYQKVLKEIGSELIREETLSQLEDILSHYGTSITLKQIEQIIKELKLTLDKGSIDCCQIFLLRESDSLELIQTKNFYQMIVEAEDLERQFYFSRQQESAAKSSAPRGLNNSQFDKSSMKDVSKNINIQEEIPMNQEEEKEEEKPMVDAKTLISDKLIQNSGKDSIPEDLFTDIIAVTEDIFQKVSDQMGQEQKTTREIFKGKIYTIPLPQTLEEVEAIKFKDLIKQIEKLGSFQVNSQQENMLTLVLQRSKLFEHKLVVLDDVNQILKSLGVIDNLPPSRRGLQYDTLDLKSVRILNRLVDYLKEKEIPVQEFVDDISQLKTIRYNNSQSQQVQIIKSENFFKKLYNLGLITHLRIHENLAQFLAIRPDFSQFLLEKKVKKVIKVFAESKAFQKMGKKKKKYKKFQKYYDMRKAKMENVGKINEISSLQQDLTTPGQDTTKKVPQYQMNDQISGFKESPLKEEQKVEERNLLEPDEDFKDQQNEKQRKVSQNKASEYSYYGEEEEQQEEEQEEKSEDEVF